MLNALVTTSSVDRRDREELWRHTLGDTFAPVVLDGWASVPDPRAELRGAQRGSLLIAGLMGDPQSHHRGDSQILPSDAALFQIAVVTAGEARLEQGGRTAELSSGGLVIYENSRPFTWTFTKPWRVAVLSLPREIVRLTEQERTTANARALSGATGLSGVVARFVADLTRHASELPESAADTLLAQTADLAVALLATETSPEASDARHRTTMTRVKGFIADHLRDPSLNPEGIAAAANVSTRLLHKLFEGEDRTVALYVRDLRLQLARRELLDQRNDHLGVATVAHRCGFGDISGFGRAFKAAYGVTPGALRPRRPLASAGE